MPRFFFDFRDGSRRTCDLEGLELESVDQAKREAMVALTQILELEYRCDDQRRVYCRVRDESGREVCAVSLSFHGEWTNNNAPEYPKLSGFVDTSAWRDKSLDQL